MSALLLGVSGVQNSKKSPAGSLMRQAGDLLESTSTKYVRKRMDFVYEKLIAQATIRKMAPKTK